MRHPLLNVILNPQLSSRPPNFHPEPPTVTPNPQLSHRTPNFHPEPPTVILNAVKDLSILAAAPIQLVPQQPLTETLR